jgi:hypothetical protein
MSGKPLNSKGFAGENGSRFGVSNRDMRLATGQAL